MVLTTSSRATCGFWKRLKPDIYVVNVDGDMGGKREYCAELGVEYLVLHCRPRPVCQTVAARSCADFDSVREVLLLQPEKTVRRPRMNWHGKLALVSQTHAVAALLVNVQIERHGIFP